MPRTILIVDDSSTNRKILKAILDRDYDILEAANAKEAYTILIEKHETVSVVLLDIVMPEIDGYAFLGQMKANALFSKIPVIMITGHEDESSRVKALSLGANDFVTKPYNPDIIKHCVRNNILLHETASIIDSIQHDKLTGLYTREAFIQKAGMMIKDREPCYYIMACFDVDKFKVINDQYGMQKGDEVLKHIATVFNDGFKNNGGICCRVSGDTFAVLYPASFQDSNEISEIRRKAANVPGLVSPIKFSIGRYIINDLSIPPGAMYDRASLAADSVKGRYDIKLTYYNEDMREHLLYEQQIVTEMENALKSNQFEVWFQPQYNHSTDSMIGAEALVRWHHPQKGMIPPGSFVPLFEQNGFIYPLDKFVWEATCQYLRKWIDNKLSPLPISVNISRYDALCPDIVDVIVGLINKYQIPVDLLRLEITESAFADSAQRIIDVVKQLIGYGFTVEIDDFGSGYSSLNTLKDVPAQIIKLDMKFLEKSNDSQRGGNIVESVVRMAKWLGMSVIAEGVETLAQANYLRSVGCNYMQGYLYSKPMPASQYEAHCGGIQKEEKLLSLKTVESLDNNSFWDPDSMDTLIFNSFVGGACIYEYHNGNIELLRATEKYAQIIGSAGMTVEDALKLNWAEHLDEKHRLCVLKDIEKSIATKKEVTGEYVFLDLPGCPHETYLRSTMRVIATTGDRHLVYCTNENITAQRKAEQKGNEFSERLQTIMRSVNCGVSAIAIDEKGKGHVIFANDKYYSLIGYTKKQAEEELTDMSEAVFSADIPLANAAIAKLRADHIPCEIEYRCVKRDGSIIYVRSNKSITHIEGRKGDVLVSVITDITQTVRAEQRAEKMSEQLQYLMDDMPGGFSRMRLYPDGSLRPVYFNKGFCHLVGMSFDEIINIYKNDSLAGVHPDDVEIVTNVISRMLKNGEAYSSRYRLRHGNGGYIWLTIFGRVTNDTTGNTFVNIYYTNATEKVKAEEQQKELLDNLPYGAALYDFDGKSLSAVHLNKRYWELVGRNSPSQIDSSVLPSAYPDDKVIIFRELTSAIRQNHDAVCDHRILCGDNKYRPFHVVARIIPKSDGHYSVYASYTPISGEAMSYQQMLSVVLSTIMESTTDLSFAKDKDFRYICASRAFTDMVGLKSEYDVVGKSDYDLFDRELADKYRHDDEALLSGGKPIIDMVEIIPSENGIPHYSSTSKYLLNDSSGSVIGLYGVGRDITEYRNTIDRLKLLTDSISGGLATYICTSEDFSPEHIHIAYFNDGLCKLFGFTREEYKSRHTSDPISMVFEEDQKILTAQWLSLIKNNTPINCIYRVHINGGGYKWISHMAVAAARQNDCIIINAVLQDVTEQWELTMRRRLSEE